jgi:hypothetical protein
MNSIDSPRPARKLAILLWAARPEQPDLCIMPFVYAATAAAMEIEVEVHFTGPAIRLLIEGCAESIPTPQGKTVYDFMRDAAQLGARFLGCSMALRDYTDSRDAKISEFSGVAGAATFVMRSLDPEWRTLCF